MAATPMYSGSNELMGVLTLASSEPHAFDKSRVVWVLAMALAPLAATLRYAVHAMHVEDFIARAMPALLEQNYVRTANRGKKIGKERTAKPTANGAAAKKGQGEGKVHHPPSSSSMEESSSSPSSTVGHPNGSMASTPTKGASELSGSALGTSTALPPESANGAVDASVSPSAGSEQFAEHAEVLITGSGSSSRSASATLASLSPKAPPMQSGLDVDGAGPGAKQSGDAVTTGPKLPRSAPASISSATPTKNHATNGTVAPANGTPSPGTTVVPSTGTAGEDSYISPHPGSDADLDWGDFFFNLVSMCIVYAYFSDAAVGGENRAAVGVSMAIAAVDILLLALRWLW